MSTPADFLDVKPPTDEAIESGDAGSWRVEDDRGGAWALRKLAEAEREIQRLADARDAELEAVRNWFEDAARAHENTASFMRSQLIGYRLRLEDEDPKLPKTYQLPGGSILRRAGRPRIEVVDEAAFLTWAAENEPAAVKRSVLKSPLSGARYGTASLTGVDHLRLVDVGSGEVVPGVEFHPPEDRYSVTVNAETSPVVDDA